MWKDIKNFEGLYKINTNGDIKSLVKQKGFYIKKETILKYKINKFGYKVICLRKNNKAYHKTIHRIVAETFIPNLINKKQVNHKDGNKLNCAVKNLEWVTPSENTKHAYKMGLRSMKGENHNNRKLNWEKVKEIRNSKEMNSILADKYGVARSLITKIKQNLNWVI